MAINGYGAEKRGSQGRNLPPVTIINDPTGEARRAVDAAGP
jgi:hypothetical protein